MLGGDKRLERGRGPLADGVPFPATRCMSAAPPGRTRAPLLRLADGRPDGAVSADGRVAGTYVHGLFAA